MSWGSGRAHASDDYSVPADAHMWGFTVCEPTASEARLVTRRHEWERATINILGPASAAHEIFSSSITLCFCLLIKSCHGMHFDIKRTMCFFTVKNDKEVNEKFACESRWSWKNNWKYAWSWVCFWSKLHNKGDLGVKLCYVLKSNRGWNIKKYIKNCIHHQIS